MTMLEPEFHTYTDKPTALLSGSYTTVRGAELRELDEMLEEQGDDVPASGFKKRFAGYDDDGVLNTDHVDDCLGFLQKIDYVEVSPQDVVSRFNSHVFPDLAFEARLLSHIRQQTGRSEHLTYISEVCARIDKRRLDPNYLLEEVQADDTGSYSDQLSWTIEKIRFWANLLDPLGALSYTTWSNESEIVASPTRALLTELITYYAEHADDGTRAGDCFRWIDEWFLPILSERAGVPHLSTAAADTLRSMEDDEAIDMFRESDAQDIVRVPRAGSDPRTVSTVTVEGSPTGAAYRYPLARTTRRISQ